MIQFLDGVDDLRKAKIMEFYEHAEVKAKQRPAGKVAVPAATGKTRAPVPAAAPVAAAHGPARPASMRPPALGKPAPLKRPTSIISVDKEPESPKRPTSIARPGIKQPGTTQPGSRIAARQSLAPSARGQSPPPMKRPPSARSVTEEQPPQPKLRGLNLGRVSSSRRRD
jgi:protein STU2